MIDACPTVEQKNADNPAIAGLKAIRPCCREYVGKLERFLRLTEDREVIPARHPDNFFVCYPANASFPGSMLPDTALSSDVRRLFSAYVGRVLASYRISAPFRLSCPVDNCGQHR
jgi:hypothetical protein